jgi:hypothetical protein
MFQRILAYNVFWQGKTILGSNLETNLYIHTFSHVFKGKNPLAISNTKSFRNNFWVSSYFL